ncbi:MAG: PTS fructose transporter subunit IIA [Gammaproteobacteria bacterium]|nr:PTS fructose transporter subunit IIA [Gammaproteobacteria bacterium]
MSVGLLILTHSEIGHSLYDTAVAIVGSATLQTEILVASMDCNIEQRLNEARRILKQLDKGQGVLILTDMYGATPSNIASELLSKQTILVSGINLPMLLRVMNYPDLNLDELAEKAVTGGQDGVLALTARGN